MNTHRHDRRCPPPKAAGWWGRLLVAGLFAFYLNYIPLHLATATHLGVWFDSVADLVLHHDGHAGHDDHDDGDHDTDHHVPHPASDHNLNLTAQTQAPVAALAVFLLLADTSVLFCEPEMQAVLPLVERLQPPGETPPDPLQPRAPPLA